MKGLMFKDGIYLKNQATTILFMVVLGAVMSLTMDGAFVVWFLSFMAAMIAAGTLSYDEFDNGLSYLFTLPVSRRTYVREKYLFAAIVTLSAALLGLLIGLGMIFLHIGGLYANNPVTTTWTDLLTNACITLPLTAILLAMMLPLRIKFGSEQSKIVWFLIMGGLMAVMVVALYLVKQSQDGAASSDFLIRVNEWISSANIGVLAIGSLIFSLTIYLISERISEHIMVRKEL